MPANCQIFFHMILNFVTFDFVDLSDEIKLFETILDIEPKETEPLTANFALFEYESLDTFMNLQQIFFYMLFFALLPLLVRIIYVLLYWSKGCQNLIRKFEGILYFNIFIRFILESYLELVIISLIRIHMVDFSTKGDTVNTLFSFVLFTSSAMVITLGLLMFYAFRHKLTDKNFKAKFGEFYASLDLTRFGSIF